MTDCVVTFKEEEEEVVKVLVMQSQSVTERETRRPSSGTK